MGEKPREGAIERNREGDREDDRGREKDREVCSEGEALRRERARKRTAEELGEKRRER